MASGSRYFDFGGGLGVRYDEEHPPDWNAYGRAIARIVKPLGCRLLLEPGRSLVGRGGSSADPRDVHEVERRKEFHRGGCRDERFACGRRFTAAVHPITPVRRSH